MIEIVLFKSIHFAIKLFVSVPTLQIFLIIKEKFYILIPNIDASPFLFSNLTDFIYVKICL